MYHWPMATCSLPGCNRPARARGLCGREYVRWIRTGSPYLDPRRYFRSGPRRRPDPRARVPRTDPGALLALSYGPRGTPSTRLPPTWSRPASATPTHPGPFDGPAARSPTPWPANSVAPSAPDPRAGTGCVRAAGTRPARRASGPHEAPCPSPRPQPTGATTPHPQLGAPVPCARGLPRCHVPAWRPPWPSPTPWPPSCPPGGPHHPWPP